MTGRRASSIGNASGKVRKRKILHFLTPIEPDPRFSRNYARGQFPLCQRGFTAWGGLSRSVRGLAPNLRNLYGFILVLDGGNCVRSPLKKNSASGRGSGLPYRFSSEVGTTMARNRWSLPRL